MKYLSPLNPMYTMGRFNQTTSSLAIALCSLLTIGVFSPPGFANPNASVSSLRQGLPGRRISGGSRSPETACLRTPDQPVIALMPKSNLGLTLSARPTFWFSMPDVSADRAVEFGLYDAEGEMLYQKTFSPGAAGITDFSLPEDAPALATGQDYRWYLSVVCDRASRSEDLVVTGWVRRIEADSTLQAQLATASPEEQVALYESQALWYDALTTLAKLQQTNPTSALRQQWTALFESIDLPQITETPFSPSLAPYLAALPEPTSDPGPSL
ncbi:MAG: DUF928 domain-containing protein [Cyanobacteria bacterium J06614_10]